MDHASPLCSVVVLNYNGRHLLDSCLESVFLQSGLSFEVILVDNGSSDGSVRHVAERFPTVRIVASDVNLGYAGGNNLGVEHARGRLVVLLNNDTVVEPGWLVSLVDVGNREDVGVASSLVLTEGIPARYYEKNGSLNFVCHNIMRIFERKEDIFYGGGASLLFKKDLFALPFDGEYFAYCEDIYLGFRARFIGFRVVHADDSVVHHKGSATAGKQKSAFTSYLQERNRLLTMLIFFSWWTLVRIAPYFVFNLVAKLMLGALTRRHSLPGLLRAYWWLVAHPVEIAQKRRRMRAERRVNEREVISWMTGKLTNGETLPGRILNAVALAWCRLVRLKTVESLPAGLR
ncbi:MAG: glycosyltransferase family 2 protein [Bacteroidota bacterium]